MWSILTFINGLAHDYTTLILIRIGLGITMSFCGPPAFSLISDYFPPYQRTTANSVYSSGHHLGESLSSLTSMLINI